MPSAKQHNNNCKHGFVINGQTIAIEDCDTFKAFIMILNVCKANNQNLEVLRKESHESNYENQKALVLARQELNDLEERFSNLEEKVIPDIYTKIDSLMIEIKRLTVELSKTISDRT